eukprot:5950186-Amphidinium_carterae.2
MKTGRSLPMFPSANDPDCARRIRYSQDSQWALKIPHDQHLWISFHRSYHLANILIVCKFPIAGFTDAITHLEKAWLM